MKVDAKDIKKLRQELGAGIADIKQALEDASGNLEKAGKLLKQKGLDKASKKAERQVKAGLVEAYSHAGKIGVVVELLCETDFVAKTEDFKNLAHELVLQIASMNPKDVKILLFQEYIRDNTQTIEDLIKSVIGKLGENIQIGRFERIELGEK